MSKNDTPGTSLAAAIHAALLEPTLDSPVLALVAEYDSVEEGGPSFDWQAVGQALFPFAQDIRPLPADELRMLDVLHETLAGAEPRTICLFPPMGRRKSSQRQGDALARHLPSLESLSVYKALQTLQSDSGLLIFTLDSFLHSYSLAQLREYVMRQYSLRWIVAYEHLELAGFHPLMQFCTILIESGQAHNHVVKMMRTPRALSESAKVTLVEEVKRLKRQGGGRTEHGYVLCSWTGAGGVWGVEANHPSWAERMADLGALGRTVPLGKIAEILVGGNNATLRNAPQDPDGVLISGQHILQTGELNFDPDENRRGRLRPTIQHLRLRPGDVLIRRIMAPYSPVRAARVPDGVETALYADHTVVVIRLLEDHTSAYGDMLRDFLCSARAATWFSQQKPGMNLAIAMLQEMPVPVPDEDTLAVWRQADDLRRTLADWQRELHAARLDLFHMETVKAGRDNLVASMLRNGQRVQAAEAVDTLGWKVRNLYPFPVAYRWRQLESLGRSSEKYRLSLEVAELLTAYLAIMALVLGEKQGPPPGYLKTIAERLKTRPKSGMNFGDWMSLLAEVATARRFRDLGPSTAYFELVDLFKQDDFNVALRWLKDRRDDAAHGRGPRADDEQEWGPLLERAEADVTTLFRRAEFVTRYPLRQVESVSYPPRRALTEYSYRDLVGDHPLQPVQQARLDKVVNLAKDTLYFATPTGELDLVFPWIVRRACPRCRSVETYTFDQLDEQTREVMLKSFERGHQVVAGDLEPDLVHVGLLPG